MAADDEQQPQQQHEDASAISFEDVNTASAQESSNPVDSDQSLRPANASNSNDAARKTQAPFPLDSSVTRAEKIESRDLGELDNDRPPKRIKVDVGDDDNVSRAAQADDRRRGFAAIKAEFLIELPSAQSAATERVDDRDRPSRDDDAEAAGKMDSHGGNDKSRKKKKGQNHARSFGFSRDALSLCATRATVDEFAPRTCPYGDGCKFEHDLRKYLREGKRENLHTFDGHCPIYDAKGSCSWKCRFLGAHSQERETPDGRKELVLLRKPDPGSKPTNGPAIDEDADHDNDKDFVNVVDATTKRQLAKNKIDTSRAQTYANWLNAMGAVSEGSWKGKDKAGQVDAEQAAEHTGTGQTDDKHADTEQADAKDRFAVYKEPPFLPSEKRRIYYGPETPVLAPLTTQGNVPFRRLCTGLGAQITWSEMAMSQQLLSGDKSEWALLRAHKDELLPPSYTPGRPTPGYNNARDIRFGAQIAGNKPLVTLKATEVLTALCPSLRAIDLNCGCPIDLVYRAGAGSALMDVPGKLEKMLLGMNAVSGEIPITAKIRMGTKDKKPTADKLINRFAFGGAEAQRYEMPSCGVAAITLHGRSRQQRYTRSADWDYIAQCSATIARHREEQTRRQDTVHEDDPRDLAPAPLFFIGNGDCYSHEDYNTHIQDAGVDSVMVARGALMKPWIFEEIAAGQHLDKSAGERLSYVEKYARYGLETWGSDEIGVGTTRRFLLEWLSFACRYVPVGILEYMPPRLQERPPAYRGRNELETLLSSDNYKDWIKISDMFLGPAHKDFKFIPKHKSSSYEIEAEG